MTYTIDIKKVEQELKDVRRIITKVKENNGNLEDLNSYVENLTNLIHDYYHLEAPVQENPIYIDEDQYVLKKYFVNYHKIPEVFRKDMNKSFKLLRNLDTNYKPIQYPRFNASNDDLVCMARDFVSWLPTKNTYWKKSFYEFSNPRNHLLTFRKFNEDDGFDGITYPIGYPTNKSYFIINRRYNIIDFFTLVHEFFHGIVKSAGEDQCEAVSELEGWYSQFLAREFLKENGIVKDKVLIQSEYDDFNVVYEFYLSLIMYHCCSILKNQKKGIDLDFINRRVTQDLKNFTFNKDVFKEYIDVDPAYFSQYIYSYLLDLDLEEQYKIDPEVSFYNFDRFVTSYRVVNHKTLKRFDFTFMKDNFKSFQKKIDRINNL